MFAIESSPGLVPRMRGFDRQVDDFVSEVILSNLWQAFEFQVGDRGCLAGRAEIVVSREQLIEHRRKGHEGRPGIDSLASNFDAARLAAYPRILFKNRYIVASFRQQRGRG